MSRRCITHSMSVVTALVMAAVLSFGCASAVKKEAAPNRESTANKRKAMDLFVDGKVSEAKGNIGGAIASYIEALQYDPYSEEIAEGIAKAFIKDQKTKSALYYAKLAAELNPKRSEIWRLLQQLYQYEGKTAEAAEALKMYIKLEPQSDFLDKIWLARYNFEMGKDKEALSMVMATLKEDNVAATDMAAAANMLAEEGYIKEAIAIYTTITERDPIDVEAWVTLGQLYEHLGEDEKARNAYIHGLEKNPGNLDILVMLGNLSLTENDWDAAIKYFLEANTAGPDLPKIRKTLAALYFYAGKEQEAEVMMQTIREAQEDDAPFYFSIGKALNYLERFEESIEYYRQGFEKSLEGIPEDELFRAFAGYAQSLIHLGRHDEAVDLIHDGAPKYINDAEGLKMLEASIYNEMKRYDDAISIYEWLIASDPKNVRFLMLLGQTYNYAKKYDKAEETFLKIKDIDPESTDYLVQLSIVYDFTGQFKKAEQSLQTVLKKEPDHSLALNNLAYMYIEHNVNLSKAISMVKTALEKEPRNGAYYDTLGWGYYKQGDFAKAKEHIESALKWEVASDKGVIFDHYGDILAKLGRKTEAADAYRKAIELGEDSAKIQPKIDAISR